MEKEVIQYCCNNCGSVFPRWQGHCSGCNSWNTIEQEIVVKPKKGKAKQSSMIDCKPLAIDDVELTEEEIIPTDIKEFDNVMGTGLVCGSVTLLGGEPGIGKSTFALQLAQRVAGKDKKVLYVSGEESVEQISLRSKRIGKNTDTLYVYSEVNIVKIIKAIEETKPDLVVMDSVQVVFHPDIPSVAGSVNQVRSCAGELIRVLKKQHSVGILIGHITKEGGLAGPKVLEHLVDIILYFEGERNQRFRILRSFKNRYASTNEIGLFEMKNKGLEEITQPSELFIDDSSLSKPGSVVSAISEGRRVLLVEVQSLVVGSGYGMAKRTFLGLDPNRANLMIAAIEKMFCYKLGVNDIIINIVGGLKVKEPALDLALVLSIISSYKRESVIKDVGVFGEVGLTGELRPVPNAEKRLLEFEKMGFTAALMPAKNKQSYKLKTIKPIYANDINEAVQVMFKK